MNTSEANSATSSGDPDEGNSAPLLVLAQPFAHGGGYCWHVQLPPEALVDCDAPGFPKRSPMKLLENGVPIGAPHALHEDVRSVGMGVYSHWKDTFYFATSDNSNPNTNGRSYRLTRDIALNTEKSDATTSMQPLGFKHPGASQGADASALAEILRRREVREIVYFHADHFEPWSSRSDDQRWRGLDRFAQESRRSPFLKKLSLFYTPWLVHVLATSAAPGDYRDGDDAVAFRRRPDAFLRNCHQFVRPLETDIGHEYHIHIHHEGWSRTTVNYGNVSAAINASSTPEADSRRLSFYTRLCREVMEEEVGRPFDRWAFVHGNWSLNASDPRSCQIEDEIAVLMRQGCYGDFTFPAGEARCDPTVLQFPYTCHPHIGIKSYDHQEADPRPLMYGAGLLTPDRFFVWNSPIKAPHSSLDFYNEANAKLFREPEALVRAWLEQSVVIDHRLYVKTHAHSMHTKYLPWEDDRYFPHTFPDTIKVFELLQKTCDEMGIPFTPTTVEGVMAQMGAFDRGESTSDMPAQPAARPSMSPAVEVERPDLEPVKAALLAGMRRLGENPIDSYYQSRVERAAVLETYEIQIIDYALKHLPSADFRLFEVGIGWGMLSICLAALGYEVVGFVGQHDHAEAARSLATKAEEVMPGIAARLRIVEGLFPDALSDGMLGGNRRNAMIVTNLVHSFSAANQQQIVEAGLRFDKVLLETGTFGISRDQDERKRLAEGLGRLFNIIETIWQERIAVMEPSASNPARKKAPDVAGKAPMILSLKPPFIGRGGHSWTIQLPPELEKEADCRETPRRSQWHLLEDGQPLQAPHSIHSDISEKGGGHFSHWSTQLYFSTSDNSDPNSNGRQYALNWTGPEATLEVTPSASPSKTSDSKLASARPEVDACAGLIAIFGASFSGSTLVNTVLGSHPEIFGGGELHWLVKDPESTVCAICRSDCRFWTPQARHESTLESLYHQVSRRFARRFVVDISKMREWYEEILPHFPDLPVVRVLLVKHPVRHVSSFIEKKDTAGNLPDGTPAYGTPDRALQRLRAFYEGFLLPGEDGIDVKYNLVEKPTQIDFVIRYEDFVASPAEALRPVLERLGLAYDQRMEAWAQAEHHHIGGNIGPRVQISNDTPALASAARKYQQRGIFLDNSFSDILDIETIETVLYDADATWMRERFGYAVSGATQAQHSSVAENAQHSERIVLREPFAHGDGNCWVANLPEKLTAEADDAVNKYQSPWRLIEDGKPIGAPHALHDDIRAVGRGRHSHWKTQLLFSSCDNSDPNVNRRRYELVRDVARAPTRRLPVIDMAVTPPRLQAGSSTGVLADILKRRGVREVVYFHTDHFEPWGGSFDDGIRALEGFASLTRRSRHGRRLNLFYTPPIDYALTPSASDPAGRYRAGKDGIVFEPLTGVRADTHRNAIGALVELGHEFHLHIHHTRWTRNTGNADATLKAWLDEQSSPEMDSQRLDLFTRLSCESIAAATARPFDRWAFIHGLWALNASDPSACMVEDEIAILMRHGCFGDFTFPAGRGHCNPTSIEAPYTCLPAHGPKAYDLPAADPQALVRGGQHLRSDRFFIWNSPIKAVHSSLDYYHEPNRVLFRTPERLVTEWLEKSVLLDGTLFIKTHSHSLEPTYRIGTAERMSPHLYPDVIALFDLLDGTCDDAGIDLHVLSIHEVMTQLCRLDETN